MKRLLTLVLMAAAVLMVSPAFAAVQSSPHDYLNSAYGRCGICHVPHAAGGGKRLWRVAPPGSLTGWAGSNVGILCYGCHGDGYLLGGSITGNAAGTGAHNWASTDGPFAATSHGRVVNTLTATLGGSVDSSKPYMSTNMECTSCHNVHFEGPFIATDLKRPFLRGASITTTSGFCATCHADRYNNNTLGASNTGGPGPTGNHPVNIAYASSGGGAYFVPISNMPANMNRPTPAGSWSLGGKFEGNHPTAPVTGATVNIGCQTCHAVHNPGAGTDDGNHLLAVNNVSTKADLCEGCHGNPTGNTARANSGAQMQVGAAAGDHPIDIQVVAPGPSIDKWYMHANDTTRAERHTGNYAGGELGAATAWPRGTTGNIICTSCHSAHRSQSGLKLIRTGWAGSGTGVGWCNACHTDASPMGHHTHSGNTGGTLSPVASALTCDSCHGTGVFGSGVGTSSLAHNGFAFSSNFALGGGSNNASQLCNACHLGGQTAAQLAEDITNSIAIGALPADHLGVVKDGTKKSHYLGAFTDNANSIHVKKNNWNADSTNYNSYSKYGAATDTHGNISDSSGTTIVCESCHSVLHNAGAATASATQTSGYMINLLLQDYKDDGHGATTATAPGSGLCIGCHNNNDLGNSAVGQVDGNKLVGTVAGINDNVPKGTHPMTGWSITRAKDAGRSPSSLITGSGSYADQATAPGQASYTAVDGMDCDSCHRPHQAPANSTYSQTKAAGAGVLRPVILEYQQTAEQWSDLCQQCHNM